VGSCGHCTHQIECTSYSRHVAERAQEAVVEGMCKNINIMRTY